MKTNNVKKNLLPTRWLNKKRISILSIATTLVSIPTSIFISQALINTGETYNINGSVIRSLDSASQILQKQSNVYEYDKEVSSVWELDINGSKQIFNSPNELRETVYSKYIKTDDVITSLDLDKYVDHSTGKLNLTDEDLSQIISTSNTNTNDFVKVFKTKNDAFTENSNEAYKSYFDVKDCFYFNNIFFNSKSDLRTYLINNYLPNAKSTNYNTFVISAPNGVKSNPISTDPAKIKDTVDYISKFIKNNSDVVLSYTNSSTKKEVNITKKNINSQISNVNIRDLEYFHVQSNEGESRYVVDNIYTDDNNLIGPYFYEGNLDIGSFTNIDMWRRTNGINKSVYVQSKIDTIIGLFFNTILGDDNITILTEAKMEKTDPLLFRTPLVDNSGVSIDKIFLDKLKVLSPKLHNELVETNKRLLQGKKYNSFFKIPVLYSFLMQRIVSWNLSNKIIELVLDYFSKIVSLVQDSIEIATLMDPSILMGNDGTKFNALKFFNIGNPEYDINTSSTYYLNQLKNNYPKLVAAMAAFNGAANNMFMAAGLIPFKSYDLSILFQYKLINENQYKECENTLKNIYDTFSLSDYKKLANSFITHAAQFEPLIKQLLSLPEAQRLDQFDKLWAPNKTAEINLYLKNIGLKNTTVYLKSQVLLYTELKAFIQNGVLVNGGYLSKIWDNKLERIFSLVNYAMKNPNSNNLYRLYYALLIDIEMKLNIFNKTMIKDSNALTTAITRITFGVLGSVGGVTMFAKNMYGKYKNTVSLNNNPLTKFIDKFRTNNTKVGSDKNFSAPIPIRHFDISDEVFSFLGNRYADLILEYIDLAEIEYLNNIRGSWKSSSSISSLNSLNIWGYTGSDTISDIVLSEPSIDSPIINPNKPFYKNPPLDDAVSIGSFSGIGIPDLDDQIDRQSTFTWNTVWSDNTSDIDLRRESIGESVIDSNVSTTTKTNKSSKSKWINSDFAARVKNKATDFFEFVGRNFFEILGGAFAIAEFAFVILDLLKVEEIQDFYVYTTIDGTEFIWDGGKTVSRYFGFQTEIVNKLNSGDLLTPIQITLPQIEEFYYYNQTKYYDQSSLKLAILYNKLNNLDTTTNKHIKIKYSFDKESDISTFNNIFDNHQQLIDFVLSDIGFTWTGDLSNDRNYKLDSINKNSFYLSTVSYAFSNGITTNPNNTNDVIANNIIDNIRTTKVVKKVQKDSAGNIINSNNEFKFPGITYKKDNFIDNTSEMGNYIVDNSANELKTQTGTLIDGTLSNDSFVVSNPKNAETFSYNKLFEIFTKSFELETKVIAKNASFITDKFTKLATTNNKAKIYSIIPIGDIGLSRFLNLIDAETYLLKYINVTKISKTVKEKQIVYKGNSFDTELDFKKYIKNNYSI